MQLSGLSSEQAPPISAVMRFFLTAPLFAVVASITLFFMDRELFLGLYTVETVAWIHFITLGFLTMIIMGAIMQMLPVLAGVSLPFAKALALFVHAGLSVGSIFLSVGLYVDSDILLYLAGIFLLLSFGTLFSVALIKLLKVPSLNATVRAMRYSMMMGLLTVLLGCLLLLSKMEIVSLDSYALLLSHMAVGVFGFASVLIIGVAFQVIPMFYVTSGFKKFCKTYVLPVIMFSLLFWVASLYIYAPLSVIGLVLILTFLLAFSFASIKKLNKRRRPIWDTSIIYWYMGLGFIDVAVMVFILMQIFSLELEYWFALSLAAFLLSILTGMLYKIVPFLVWFHLNAQGYMSIPSIRDMISQKLVKIQFVFFILMLCGFAFLPLFTWMIKFTAVSMFVSFSLLFVNVLQSLKTYRYYQSQKPDFDISSMKI